MPIPKLEKAMSLNAFYDELERHDWYYDFSDDHSVWKRGMAERNRLEGIANSDLGLRELYDGFRKHHFTGKAWGNEKQPKPKRPGDEPIEWTAKEGGLWHPIQHLFGKRYPHALRWEDGRVWDVVNGWRE